MSDVRNIVVIGGASAGLGIAHSFLKHTLPSLKSGRKYKVHVIEPSKSFWWRISAPRAMVSLSDMPHKKTFLPIADGMKQYNEKDYELHEGFATSIDTTNRTVTFTNNGIGQSETIPYYSLVIATGISTPTPLTSLHGDHEKSVAALDRMNKRLPTAKTIVIGGGGPVAVESAGEIGDRLNGAAGWFKSRPDSPKAKITLISGSDQLLPVLSKSASDKAEKFLNRVGVDVIYKTRIEKVDLSAADRETIGVDDSADFGISTTDKSIVHLSNGETMETDIYIPAVGAKPNTSFVPKELLDSRGHVKTDNQLRVEGAGPRVYAVGDVGSYTTGGMMSIFSAVPVLSTNLANDLEEEGGEKATGKPKATDKVYTYKADSTQFVPVGKSKGVAQLKGTSMPSIMVWAIKGRDYFLSTAPQLHTGTKW